MPVPSTLITINGVSLSRSEISSWKLTYNKLWKDADRNMNGDVSASFIGVFPNFDITTGILPISKIESLSAAINTPYFSVTYWDTQTQSNRTANYYAADFDTTLINQCTYGTIQVQLVAVSKASYI
jgi:hypothetical protein